MIDLYKARLNLQNATFSRIDHNDALVAVVYRITLATEKQFILKTCNRINDYLREVHFLTHFAELLPVPRIIQVVPPEENLHGAVLMEYIPGHLLQHDELTETLAYDIGRSLAKIHLNRLPGYGDPVQCDFNSDPRIYFTSKFDEGLKECSANLPKDLIEKCRQYYDSHVDLLLSVDGPCIVHRDFRPGNLIVDDGKLQGIIDWAGARASFAEEDFCSFEHGEWPTKIKESFLSGYASIRPVPDYNRILLFLRLNKAVATVGFTVKTGKWNTTSAELYQYNRRFLETI